MLVLPSTLQIVAMSHFNYDEFAPKRHVNRKKIAEELSADAKQRLLKVDEDELDEVASRISLWNKRIYDDSWAKVQMGKIEKKLSLLNNQMG